MAALGLITQKTAEQLQSRRSERKRRSTANPQFSNYDRNDVEVSNTVTVVNPQQFSSGACNTILPLDLIITLC